MPRAFTSTLSFMIRYFDVVADDMRRMRVARQSRGYDPRWLWQARAVATSAGALFIRSYERGERVHLAMLSRGFTGSMPELDGAAASARSWIAALVVPLLAVTICAIAWGATP
jgi:cobalt/nickel transport system permease protein